jgi:RHS repeat-associated protein
LLDLGFVFASDDGSATIRIIMFITEGLGDSSGLSYYGARYLAPWLTRWISPDLAGAVDDLNLYVYVGNNPTWVLSLPAMMAVPTYQNNNLFYFPEAYERLENIVRTYPTDKFNLIDANTEFSVITKGLGT